MMNRSRSYTRREFIRTNTLTALYGAAGLGLTALIGGCIRTGVDEDLWTEAAGETDSVEIHEEPIIDIHQHTPYGSRPHDELIAHQQANGITLTILLPAGSPVRTPATHFGESNGLAARAGGNEEVYRFVQEHPDRFLFGANEVPGLPTTVKEIQTYLERGAKVIGEQKFSVEIDSPEMMEIYELARAYQVPVLMHWQYGRYNHGYERFDKVLEKYPDVTFIGHSRSWWANIDKNFTDQTKHTYPSGKVTPGGWSDLLLSRYPNMYGDLSQTSGLTALTRDEVHAKEFLDRHQDQLLFGSDCSDRFPSHPKAVCTQGIPILKTIRRLSSSKTIERKILYENAKKLFLK